MERLEKKDRRNHKKTNIVNKKFINKYLKYDFSKTKFNITLFFLAVFIGFIGLFVLLSASSYLTIRYDVSRYYYFFRQSIYYIIGLVAMIIISKINYNIYKKYAMYIYVIAILLLILAYVPGFSVRVNGARRSINLGIKFMPSDIAKLATIFFLARFLIFNRRNREDFVKSVIPTGVLIGIPFVLILAQPDLSTSLVFIITMSLVYLVGGFRAKFLVPIIIIIAILGYFIISNLRDYQINRITAFRNPELHYEDLSWQVLNGLFAVSRGGIGGAGYGKSIYKHGYLATEVSNDMIFAVFGEEFGFIGSVILLLLIFSITYLIINEAIKSRDNFAKLTCFGIGVLYFIQSMINIGVSLSVIPNTGITLPFISNGGSSLVAFYIMFGVVLNISRKNNYERNLKNNMKKTEN